MGKFDRYLNEGLTPTEAIMAYKRDHPDKPNAMLKKAQSELLIRLVEERGMAPEAAIAEVKKAFASAGIPEEEPSSFEQAVSLSIRRGATPQQAVRGAAAMYPRLQADYFTRIRAGQPDALGEIWK